MTETVVGTNCHPFLVVGTKKLFTFEPSCQNKSYSKCLRDVKNITLNNITNTQYQSITGKLGKPENPVKLGRPGKLGKTGKARFSRKGKIT